MSRTFVVLLGDHATPVQDMENTEIEGVFLWIVS